MNSDGANIPAEVIAPFGELLTDQERVEVFIVASAIGRLKNLNDGLQVPVEEPMQEITRTISLDKK